MQNTFVPLLYPEKSSSFQPQFISNFININSKPQISLSKLFKLGMGENQGTIHPEAKDCLLTKFMKDVLVLEQLSLKTKRTN